MLGKIPSNALFQRDLHTSLSFAQIKRGLLLKLKHIVIHIFKQVILLVSFG